MVAAGLTVRTSSLSCVSSLTLILPRPTRFLFMPIDEFFDPGFLKSIYSERLGRLFEEFKRPAREGGNF